MTDLCRSSTLEHDPLQAYSGLCLFPRTLKSLSIPLPSRHFQSDNLQQTHTLLESMPFEVQKEHQEQAKAILDESSGFGTSVASQDMNEGVKMNPIPNRRERRPDLDSNRGHFVFKPKISAPPQNEPTFDVSKYPRPEDYFAAYDRYELAKGEWQKQTGSVITDTHQNQPTRRPRRPGMPGMERGSFTHSFMKDDPADAINQEASEKKDPILSEQSLEMDTAAHVSTVGREVDESNVDTDKNVTSILAELLAYSPDKLEGDACAKILEERLRLKPINLEKFTLPELPDVRKMDLKTSGRKPSNRRSVLSDIQNLAKGINRDEARKKSQSPAKDQYSFPDNDNLLPGDQQTSEVDVAKDLNICSRSLGTKDAHNIINNASPSTVDTVHVASPSNGSVQKTSDENDSDTHSGIHKFNLSPAGKADNCVDDSITNRNSATLEVDADMHSKRNEEDVPMGEQGAIRNTGRRENDADINEETDRLESLAEYASKEAASMGPLTVEKDSIPCQQDESSKSPKRAPEQYQTMDRSFEHAERQHGEENDNTDTACELEVENAQEVDNSSPKQTKKRRKKGSRDSDGNMNKRSKTVHGESEGDKQMKTLSPESGAKKQTKGKSNERKEKKQMKTSTRESRVKKQTKEKSNESKEKKQMKTVTREGKVFARRKSLAGAGTKWESGVRRSTRIKSRPLEYWKGERLLFGRIHESLATLIGIKYESPGKSNGKEPALKVKSFVSDDYKELVDSVALH